MTPHLHKVVPVVIRTYSAEVDILAFEHLLAGCQIVKGTLKFVETCARMAIRSPNVFPAKERHPSPLS